jgi:O-methyltransferase
VAQLLCTLAQLAHAPKFNRRENLDERASGKLRLTHMLKSLIRRAMEARGKLIITKSELDDRIADIPNETVSIYRQVEPFTMTSLERIAGLVDATKYVVEANISGSIVECGVWRGGSSMCMALAQLRTSRTPREMYLFDTFEGMPDPSDADIDYLNRVASEMLIQQRRLTFDQRKQSVLLAYSPLDEVQRNMEATRYPTHLIHYVKGRVEQTIPSQAPANVSLLRLDTDWYESTKHELLHMWPRVSPGGIVIIDDYGHWRGSRRATDEYFDEIGLRVMLHRMDYTGRMIQKPY